MPCRGGPENVASRLMIAPLTCSQLLKGRHMMVRVGGGWDTLEHFLARHDPCQVRVLNRESTPPLARGTKHDSFLHIRAKYRSAPSETNLSRRSLA